MKAALLSDRGVVKVVGEDARKFLHGLLTANIETMTPGDARYGALLTPQGKIITDCIVVEAKPDTGGGFFIDCPRALASSFATKLNFYKLRASVMVEDLSETLGVLAAWDGTGTTEYGLCYTDPRLPALGLRVMIPPHLAQKAADDLGAALVDVAEYESHRIALGIPRGGADFAYGDAFPHEADMDQLAGVDFKKGCFVGQEVVARMQHRGTARTRIVTAEYEGAAPEAGVAMMAGEKNVGTFGTAANGRGIALVRLDRVADALAAGASIEAGGVPMKIVTPTWAQFTISDPTKAT